MHLRAYLAMFITLCAALFGSLAHAQTFPAATGQWVIDQADIIPAADEAALNTKLEQFEKTNGHQLIVVTVNSLEGRDIADYGYQAGRHYQVGEKEKNNGALLLVAPNERKVHIAVGYGLEPILTDAYSSLIINQAITPQFKAGDFPGGINAGIDQIIKQISLPPEEARARAEQIQQPRSDGDSGAAIFWIIVLLFIILPIILRMMRGNRGRRYGGGPVVVWGPGYGSGYGGGGFGGGSSSSGGGFGGGGFSGGGGSFGGGGASGSW